MMNFKLDPTATLGGILHTDNDQEIVQLVLQKGNEVADYQSDAIILLIVLAGKAEIISEKETVVTDGMQIIRMESNERHSIRALENQTVVMVLKQLTHELTLSKRLRFGNCCL